MPSLDTTNLILAVIALSVFVQTAMLVAVALWLRGQRPEYKARPRHRCRTIYY